LLPAAELLAAAHELLRAAGALPLELGGALEHALSAALLAQ
jgi:hypothetical protein